MPLAVVVALALPRVVEALWSGVARLELHRLDGRSPVCMITLSRLHTHVCGRCCSHFLVGEV